MSDELAVMDRNQGMMTMPAMNLDAAKKRRQALVDFTGSIMVPGTDYGQVPGTGGKPTLLKPGAEKLTTFFGLSPRFILERRDEDWTGKSHGDEPFFHYQYRCQLWRGDTLVGEGLGSCNSWEKKYRYRNADLKCPNCGEEGTVIKGKAEYGGGWLCWNKKGGCGSKWSDGAPEIENQDRGKVLNDNPADLVNTIDKMAQKRALVAATLIAVNASEFFTQDIEDMDFGVVEGEYTETATGDDGHQPRKPKRQKPAPKQPRKNGGNGGPTLADFAVGFAERHDYFKDNFHVVGTLKKLFGDDIASKFGTRKIEEYEQALDEYANEGADAEAEPA